MPTRQFWHQIDRGSLAAFESVLERYFPSVINAIGEWILDWPAWLVLGLVLIFVGIVQIAQSGKMKGEAQFAWHLALGLVAAIGGVFVYLDPFEGVVTLTILMAIVFAMHGLTQIAFALRVRRLRGWSWFLLSGCVALLVAALLVMKLPYGHTFTSATVGGVSLLFAGWAYIALARVSRQAP